MHSPRSSSVDLKTAHPPSYRAILGSLLAVLTTTALSARAHANPVVSGLDAVGTLEQDPARIVDADISVTGGGDFSDGFIRFSLNNPDASDTLALTAGAGDPSASGNVTVVGNEVFVGTGSETLRIGSVDAVENGQGGSPLRILFSSPLENAGFETGDLLGWTPFQQNYGTSLNGRSIQLSYPGDSGTGTVALGTPRNDTYTVQIDSSLVSSGNFSLRLQSRGNITFSNPSGVFGNQNDGYGSMHGPSVLSSPFTAEAGDSIFVDWSAQNGSDSYEVFGFLVGAGPNGTFGDGDDTRTELFSQRGNSQAWITTTAGIATAGEYRFEFVCGTYDQTGGFLVGASLYVDNIRVVSSATINDSIVTAIARLVSFENTGDDPPTGLRTLTVSVETATRQTGSASNSLTITPENDPPTGFTPSTLTVSENLAVGGTAFSVAVDDPEASDVHTLEILTSNVPFAVNGLSIETTDVLDHETEDSYELTLLVTDLAGATYSETVTVAIQNVPEPPTGLALTNASVSENLAAGALVGTLGASDPEDGSGGLTYSLVTTGVPFQVANGNEVRTTAMLDRESQGAYMLTFRATDSDGLFTDLQATIAVGDVNEAPTGVALAAGPVSEGATPGTSVGTLQTSDGDLSDAHVFEIIDLPSPFDIGPSGNELRVAGELDFEASPTREVSVRVTDSGGLTFEGTVVVTLQNINDTAPVIEDQRFEISELATGPVGTVLASDPDTDPLMFAILGGSTAFAIDNSGALSVIGALDFEETPAISLAVQVDDGTFQTSASITVDLINENDSVPVVRSGSFSVS
ncbi:MAG: cadherin repeat domain-containing protein, partial [Myxococcota bacterium]